MERQRKLLKPRAHLTASLERTPPKVDHTIPERCERPDICWNREVCEVPANGLAQPLPLLGDRPVHAPSQLHLDVLESRPHAVAAGLPLKLEVPLTRFSADERKPQECKGLRFAEPTPLAVGRRVATKLNQASLRRGGSDTMSAHIIGWRKIE